MKPFDDLTTAEKAALTEDQVRAYCTRELMEQGVLEPKAPELLDETEPTVPTQTFYQPGYDRGYRHGMDLVFDTVEQARQFIELQPRRIESSFPIDTKYVNPMPGMTVKPVELATEQDFLELKAKLAEAAENKSANRKMREEFEKGQILANDTVSWIWEKYREAQAEVRHLENVMITFAEYLEITGGDQVAARKFLVKAYDEQTVQAAIGDEGKESVEERATDG